MNGLVDRIGSLFRRRPEPKKNAVPFGIDGILIVKKTTLIFSAAGFFVGGFIAARTILKGVKV